MTFSTLIRSPKALTVLCALLAVSALEAQTTRSVEVPSNLRPPAGHRSFLTVSAVGTQNFICLPAGWTFIGPQATLFLNVQWIGGTIQVHAGTHYLSPNREEAGMPRPLWQLAADNSIVWARQVDASSDPAYVRPDAIPWLLLERAGTSGGGVMGQVTHIQRVNTTGGLKPVTTCTVGAREFVPYTADYVFYRKSEN